MKAVAVKELKNRLSAYLREVKSGEVVLVTDRGQVIAELRQPAPGTPRSTDREVVERLCTEGALHPGLAQDPGAYLPSPLPVRVASGDLLDAERGER